MSNKKEIQIGETVQVGELTLVCEERSIDEDCRHCELYELNGLNRCLKYIGTCVGLNRNDCTDVVFKLKTE